MSKKEKKIEVRVLADPNQENQQLVQIKNETIGVITQQADRFDCVVGDRHFHEKTSAAALQQVVSEYNLHQR